MNPIAVQTGGPEERLGIDETYRSIRDWGFDAVDVNVDHLLAYGDIREGRIPGILVTSRSTVLVYHEARREESDWAHMDILLQRSGRDEQALMTTIAALVVVLMMLVQKISELFGMIKSLFHL